VLLRRAFQAAPKLLFHTEHERRRLEKRYGIRVRAGLVRHVDGVRVHSSTPRSEARRRLSLPGTEPVFVAPGFLHPGKGLERAVEAFRRVVRGRLYVIGSVRDPVPENITYAERLRELTKATAGAELVEGFVDDGTFDDWIAAADAVVLPYRRSWSSGVLARAQALGTPAIVAAVGGLPEQASANDVVVRNDDELAAAMDRVARAPRRRVAP
jgi:glycosyltransferase involved in cell wall biosynthesis